MKTATALKPTLTVVEPDLAMIAPPKNTLPTSTPKPAARFAVSGLQTLQAILPPIIGFALFLGIWALVSQNSPNLPGPVKTWQSAVQ